MHTLKRLRRFVTKDERKSKPRGVWHMSQTVNMKHHLFLHCPCVLTPRNSGFRQPWSLQGRAVSGGRGRGRVSTLRNEKQVRELHI